jgi:hypothetical protein
MSDSRSLYLSSSLLDSREGVPCRPEGGNLGCSAPIYLVFNTPSSCCSEAEIPLAGRWGFLSFPLLGERASAVRPVDETCRRAQVESLRSSRSAERLG